MPDKRLLQGPDADEPWAAVHDRIQVTGAHPADVVVDIDGTVRLPEIGIVEVAGRTRGEIESILAERYGPYHGVVDHRVEIRKDGQVYSVLGEVAEPGPRHLSGHLTIREAVELASPRCDTSNLRCVSLVRGRQVTLLDLTAEAASGVTVHERDVLFVPSIPDEEPDGEAPPIILAVQGNVAR
jgi:protein involved in polysaccharide export with SLBB domain